MGPAVTEPAKIEQAGFPPLPRLLGEAEVAQQPFASSLAARCRPEVRFLHGRAVPGAGPAIDHLAIAPGGVWVIDARRHAGEAHVTGRGAAQQLWIGDDDRTDLLDALERKVALVSRVVEEIAPDVRTFGALCLVDTQLPPFRTLTGRGFALCSLEAVGKRISVDGVVDAAWAELLAEELAAAFPAC